MAEKNESFERKLGIWEGGIPKKYFGKFPSLISIVDKDGYLNLRCLTSVTAGHLRSLSEHCSVYFPPNDDPRNSNKWVRKLFNKNNIMGTNLTLIQEDKLPELSCDRGLEASFKNATSLSAFWINIRPEYVEVSDIAIKVLLLFSYTYLCEEGFLALTSLKTKHQNTLDVRASLCVALSNTEPHLDKLCSMKQAPRSH
jgi:hypothetical protein